MSIETRQPTGKPPWPIMLLAGGEKAGKSYASALASASELVGQTFWIGIGEDDPDEYGAIPGADFKIVLHNGTYADILAKLRAALAEPTIDAKPNLIVIDSGTRLWELLSDEAQALATSRAQKAAEKYKKPFSADTEATIGPDLWNRATGRWCDVMDLLRTHKGPSIITARLEIVMVMDAQGKPTKDRTSKIKAQKSLPFDVGVIVEMPARGETYITGVRSLQFDVQMGEKKPMKDFTVDGLWRILGVDKDGSTSPRQYSGADGHASAVEPEPQSADAAAATVNRYRQDRPAPVQETAPTEPDWPSLFEAAKGNEARLRSLRNMGRQAKLPNTYGLFAAIETELARIASETPVEGKLVEA